jgi:hypothetical protein
MIPTHRPLLARILPFAVYIAFLVLEQAAESWAGGLLDPRWIYPVKVSVVAFVLWHFRKDYVELNDLPRPSPLLVALGVGVLVWALWINLDQGWLNLSQDAKGFDPRTASGELDWGLVLFRILGAALVVPLMEELFWRSFLMRWIEQSDFLSVTAARVSLRALLISSVVFGFEHGLWFAGILAGLAYGGLYRRYGNLWVPIAAHAVTNLTLGLWVLHSGMWTFW